MRSTSEFLCSFPTLALQNGGKGNGNILWPGSADIRVSVLTLSYSLATFMGTVVAVSDVNIPHATKIYIAMVIAVAAINRWVTAEFGRKEYV